MIKILKFKERLIEKKEFQLQVFTFWIKKTKKGIIWRYKKIINKMMMGMIKKMYKIKINCFKKVNQNTIKMDI
jgi:hypothetical protein